MTDREQRIWDMAFVASVFESQATAAEHGAEFSDRELARQATEEADHVLRVYRLAMDEVDHE